MWLSSRKNGKGKEGGPKISGYKFFHFEDCNLCGECFYRCKYLNLNREEAIREKKKLLEGKDSLVLMCCISCYACNVFCPNDCRPYELITERWHERYYQKGLPVRVEYLMPHANPNFRSDLVNHMNNREKALINKWQQTKPEGEMVLYPGCNSIVLPHLLDASFMQGIVIA